MKYLKALVYFFIPLLILLVVVSTLNYFNVIPNDIMKYINLVIIILCSIIGSLYVGKNSVNKGYLEGIKMGLIISIILFIFGYLAYDKGINLERVIFYFIVLVSSVVGSVIGINKKLVKK